MPKVASAIAGGLVTIDPAHAACYKAGADRKVTMLLYNQQVISSLTGSFISLTQASGVPVVGVYETVPVPGYDYQSWVLAEVNVLGFRLPARPARPNPVPLEY